MGVSERWRKLMDARVELANQKRKDAHDPFRSKNGYSYDFVIVFKVLLKKTTINDTRKKNSMKAILDKLAQGGIQTKLFYSVQHDEVYCKLRAPIERLEKEADRINYKFPVDSTLLANKLKLGNAIGPEEKHWKPVDIPQFNFETKLYPYDYIYIDYDGESPENVALIKKQSNGTIFRGVDRLKLISSIIRSSDSQGGCNIDIFKLKRDGCIIGFFALHDNVELRYLEEKWLRIFQFPWLQHIDLVKDYFGEKIGLYFGFLGHYTTWLISAAFFGFFGWIGVAADNNNPNSPVMPYFATFIAIWSSLFLEFWKRKEKTIAMKWGTVNYEVEEQDRPQFEGDDDVSPVDGSPMKYFPKFKFALRLCQSTMIISVLIFIVLGVIAGIFAMRIIFNNSSNAQLSKNSGIIAALVNAVQIQVLNFLYGSVATALNDYENHRTDTEYEDALIAKTFVFQFVNSLSSLFYIAFIKPYMIPLDSCKVSCMAELQTGLGTIFLTRLATGGILKIVIPYVSQQYRIKTETEGVDKDDLTEVETQFLQQDYDMVLGTFQDFADLVIQFAYATMFISAFPLATVMALVSNYVALRIDAWKLCQLCRRPEPRTCEDIGTWYTILEIVSISAVITNSALVAFTGTFTLNYTWADRTWVFIGINAGILLTKFIVAVAIPDVPLEVEIQLKRQAYIYDKIVSNIPDEEYEIPKPNSLNSQQFSIIVTDDDPL
eukprot:gene17170-22686_t